MPYFTWNSLSLHYEVIANELYCKTIRAAPQLCKDIFFIHGFGDRLLFHTKLFDFLLSSNLPIRFIGLDLPQHGGTKGDSHNNLDYFSFGEVVLLFDLLEKCSRISKDVPILFIGYSLGGLITTRLLQFYLPKTVNIKERTVVGACLLSPAVATRLFMGRFGFFTKKTLAGLDYKPRSQFEVSLFGFRILAHARKARNTPLPTNIPILILVGDRNRDKYCKVKKIKKWAMKNKNSNSKIVFHEIDKARHPIDGESQKIASQAFQIILDFIQNCTINNLEL